MASEELRPPKNLGLASPLVQPLKCNFMKQFHKQIVKMMFKDDEAPLWQVLFLLGSPILLSHLLHSSSGV